MSQFTAGVVDICGKFHLNLLKASRIFDFFRNDATGITRVQGETDWWKNLTSKISWHCSFIFIGLPRTQSNELTRGPPELVQHLGGVNTGARTLHVLNLT
jgi:hypothetical protein